MAVYPQLVSGALGQYPIYKRRRLRTVRNHAADGRAVRLADPSAEATEWRLEYVQLSESEAQSLRDFFVECEGSLQSFTFLDPTANLLAWSETLSEAVWACEPLLSLSENIADPLGGTRASRLTNTGGGAQNIAQTLAAPADYQYCFSLYARSTTPVNVTLLLGSGRADRIVMDQWARISYTATGEATFGLELPAGSDVDVFGLQVEPQPAASGYKRSTTGGVYENARLRDDSLAMKATCVGQHSCTVNIIHANHL